MAQIKATYTVPELARMAGMSRFAMGCLLTRAGVEFHRAGTKRLVFLAEFKRALPGLWESILDASDLIELRGGGEEWGFKAPPPTAERP